MFRRLLGARKGISGNAQHHVHHNIFLSFTLKALLILSLRCSDEKRAKSREAQKRETRAIARARVQLAEKERERERESTRRISLTFFLLFFFKGVVVWLTFSLFFAQIWVHKLKLSRVSRKERFLRDIKFKLWNNKRYITVTLRGVLERERENKKKNFSRERDWSC